MTPDLDYPCPMDLLVSRDDADTEVAWEPVVVPANVNPFSLPVPQGCHILAVRFAARSFERPGDEKESLCP